jgi:hypothetical protein
MNHEVEMMNKNVMKICRVLLPLTLTVVLSGCGYEAGGKKSAEPSSGQKGDTVGAQQVARPWKHLLKFRISSFQEAESMINMDFGVDTPSETVEDKFDEFVVRLEMRCGERLPIKLSPTAAEQMIPGWTATDDDMFNRLLPVDEVTVEDFLDYIADEFSLEMEVTDTALVFTPRVPPVPRPD